jgi:hypothetical protein
MYWFTRSGNHFPTGNHHDHRDEGGEQHKPKRNAVNAQVVVDVEALDPHALLDELHRSSTQS